VHWLESFDLTLVGHVWERVGLCSSYALTVPWCWYNCYAEMHLSFPKVVNLLSEADDLKTDEERPMD
jgi:hypothetical protein